MKHTSFYLLPESLSFYLQESVFSDMYLFAHFFTPSTNELLKTCLYLLCVPINLPISLYFKPCTSIYVSLYVCWYSLPFGYFIILSHYHALFYWISFQERRGRSIFAPPSTFNITSLRFSNFWSHVQKVTIWHDLQVLF